MSPLSSADTDAEATEAVETPEVDEAREAVVALFREELGDAVLDHHIRPGDDLWIRVERAAWRQAGFVLRDRARCKAFGFLSAIDWLPSPYGLGEDSPTDAPPEPDTEIVTGYAGGDTRFQVFARATSHSAKLGVTLKTDIPDDDLTLDTWLSVYAGVDWHERELREMFGITAIGHGHLAPLYLPGEFEGHPLRKDFPLLARHVKAWPGIVDVEPMPAEAGGADEEASE
mgnify:CR=1 FL=1